MSLASCSILYLSSQFPTRLNPQMGVFSVERIRALARNGCQMGVVAPLLMTPPPNLARKPSQMVRWMAAQWRLPQSSCLENIEVCSPKWLLPPRQLSGWYFTIFLYAQIKQAVLQVAAELKPQVILSSWLPDGVAACRLGERLGIPVVCIADGSDVNEWPQKYRGWKYARNILNQKASALIYVSEALRLAGVANGLHPQREAVIHNAVDVRVFKPSLEERGDGLLSILAVGRMVPVKGYHILLEAFADLTPRLEQPARLTFVGDGPLRQALENQAARLGITPAVRFIGGVSPEQVPAYYQAADLLCLPSLSEGLPCVAVEALACGLPVVASAVGGVPELVNAQSGILVPPGDPKALREALLQAAGKSWDAKTIRQKIVGGFSWEQWTEKVFQVINSVTAGSLAESQSQPEERVWPGWR